MSLYNNIFKNAMKHADSYRKGKIGVSYILVWWFAYLATGFVIGSICWTYSINTWLVWLDRLATVRWYHGGLISFVPFIGKWGFACAIVTFVVSLFI